MDRVGIATETAAKPAMAPAMVETRISEKSVAFAAPSCAPKLQLEVHTELLCGRRPGMGN
jgi:hypothetical protein